MKFNYLLTMVLLACGSYSVLAEADVIQIIPASSTAIGSCMPFGADDYSGGTYGPDRGFIYRDIPAFDLVPGSTIAFDLGKENDDPIEFDIGLVASTSNGGATPAAALTRIVSNTQHAADPDGDNVVGNYELVFTVEQAFSFPGGGLIINFSNPGPNFVDSVTCSDGWHVYTDSSDSSGYFVARYLRDVFVPGSSLSPNPLYIGGFIIDTAPTVIPTVAFTATTDGSEPSTDGQFTVTSSEPAGVGGLTVNYAVDAASTATAGVDYTALSGSLVIPEGNVSGIITVQVIDDPEVETAETVVVNLSDAADYDLGSESTATVFIGSDDVQLYNVTAAVSVGNGSVSCNPTSVSAGGSSTCTAVPDQGFQVSGWTGACAAAGTSETCVLSNIQADQTSAVNFEVSALAPVEVRPVPTLSKLGLVMLGLLMVTVAAIRYRW